MIVMDPKCRHSGRKCYDAALQIPLLSQGRSPTPTLFGEGCLQTIVGSAVSAIGQDPQEASWTESAALSLEAQIYRHFQEQELEDENSYKYREAQGSKAIRRQQRSSKKHALKTAYVSNPLADQAATPNIPADEKSRLSRHRRKGQRRRPEQKAT